MEIPDKHFYHQESPEYKISIGDTREGFTESWTDKGKFSDSQHNSLTTYELQYFNTTLAEVSIVDLDGWRYHLPLPKNSKANHDMSDEIEIKYFVSRASNEYKVAKLLRQYNDIDIDETLIRCDVELID